MHPWGRMPSVWGALLRRCSIVRRKRRRASYRVFVWKNLKFNGAIKPGHKYQMPKIKLSEHRAASAKDMLELLIEIESISNLRLGTRNHFSRFARCGPRWVLPTGYGVLGEGFLAQAGEPAIQKKPARFRSTCRLWKDQRLSVCTTG
jgi:hypothetical protein